MSNRPIMAGAPTVEINIDRYDELLHAEVKAEQYKTAIARFKPELVDVIEAVEIVIEEQAALKSYGLDSYDESEVDNEQQRNYYNNYLCNINYSFI